jgi:hypothetical protein
MLKVNCRPFLKCRILSCERPHGSRIFFDADGLRDFWGFTAMAPTDGFPYSTSCRLNQAQHLRNRRADAGHIERDRQQQHAEAVHAPRAEQRGDHPDRGGRQCDQ